MESTEPSRMEPIEVELNSGTEVTKEEVHTAWRRLHKRMKRRRHERKEERRIARTRVILMLWMWQMDQSPLSVLPFEVMCLVISHVKGSARIVEWW